MRVVKAEAARLGIEHDELIDDNSRIADNARCTWYSWCTSRACSALRARRPWRPVIAPTLNNINK